MKKPLSETLYQSLKISVYVFTFIMLVFGCLYVRDQHWFEAPEPRKAVRYVSVDKDIEILVRADQEENTMDPWESFSTLFDGAMQNGNVPLGEMIDTFLDSEFVQSMFTEEELEELRKTAEISEELFRQIMEAQGKE